ncbi:MAG: hypothetical protein OJF60_002527 [Burkholderiaceae bacterium]|jgi:hypothetical protein|nr:MAG: hypothetical protein OJF60_002527 [Burkholderiaceae bacterium]
MNWLARLKNENVPSGDATKTTKTVFVVSVAPVHGHIGKIHGPEGVNDAELAKPADSDRDCWPNGPAMNTGEIERLEARVELFRRRGLSADLAAAMADKLVKRDREGDDRVLCLECSNLRGRRCTAWEQAGITPDVRDLLTRLQRCPGFAEIAR